MIILFISLLSASFCLQYFQLSNSLLSVNRIVVNTPKELFETSIPLIQSEGNFIAYFNKETLEEKLNEYYHSNLDQYVKTLNINLYYYNSGNHSICLNDKCTAVDVTVQATFSFKTNYSRTLFYEIKEGN